jgi:hypothetical protein
MMQSSDHFHNRKTSLTSPYPLLFRDNFCAEFCGVTNSLSSFCDERLIAHQRLNLGFAAIAAGGERSVQNRTLAEFGFSRLPLSLRRRLLEWPAPSAGR